MVFSRVLSFLMLFALPAKQEAIQDPLEEIINHVLKEYLNDCQVIMLATLQQSIVLSVDSQTNKGHVLLTGSVSHHTLAPALTGDYRAYCRGLIVYLNGNGSSDVLRLLELARMWKLPMTRVVLVGYKTRAEDVLFHRSLRNTIHGIYLALQDTATEYTYPRQRLLYQSTDTVRRPHYVTVYRLCQYCNGKEREVIPIGRWTPISCQERLLFKDDYLQTLNGYKLRIVTVEFFPFMDYERHSDTPGTTVTPTYSVDAYLLDTLMKKINFTYIIREEPQLTWGKQKDGVFSGMMGQLQREEVDFCTSAGPTPNRNIVMDYVMGYPSDMMTVITQKPTLLPQQFALIRPFTGNVWAAVLTIILVWALALWTLPKCICNKEGYVFDFGETLLNSWGALLHQQAKEYPLSASAKVLVCWWLMFCLILTTAYQSSLIAHLTIQSKSNPPETFGNLVEAKGWKWATEPWLLKGFAFEYFSEHPDPIVRKIYKEMQVLDIDESLKKVLKGKFAVIDYEKYVSIIIASNYTDERGRSPFQISKKRFSVMAAFGWGFRKGAPFYYYFQDIMRRLADTGIIKHWTESAIAQRIFENRKIKKKFIYDSATYHSEAQFEQVVLGLDNLQDSFYLMFIALFVSFMTLVVEKIAAM